MRDIFSHPWVIEMEEEMREDIKRNNGVMINYSSKNTLNRNNTQPIIKTNSKI